MKYFFVIYDPLMEDTAFEELEAKFGYREYIYHDNITAYVVNYLYASNDDGSAHGKIYLISEKLENYYIKVPFLYTLLIDCKSLYDVEEYVKQKYAYGYVRSELVEKYNCTMFNHLNMPKKQYLKVYMKYLNTFNELVRDLKKIAMRNTNENNIEQVYKNMVVDIDCHYDVRNYITNIYEYDIPNEINLANAYDIRAGNWYNIKYDGCEYSIQKSSIVGIPEFKIFAWDIETTKKPLKFPDPEFDQIMMISASTESLNYLIINRSIVSDDITPFEFSPKNDEVFEFLTCNMETEELLLLKFIEIIYNHKPHIVTTYNGSFFDFPFVEKRLEKYNLSLKDLTGFYNYDNYYTCSFIVHLDCYKWVARDSYLPIGSQGLKAVTKAKLGYLPNEIDPEEMLDAAKNDPVKLASYSVSDAVATYCLFTKYVRPHIFSLCSILPYAPCSILCKGSGTLCEALLIIEAYRYDLLIPKENAKEKVEIYDNHLVANTTYVGGYVESLKSGIFRSDLEHEFCIDKDEIHEMIEFVDIFLEDCKEEIDYYEIRNKLKTDLEQLVGKHRVTGNVYHLDVNAMYPNIILTNRLQPTSIVDENICVRCSYSSGNHNCKRYLNWNAKLEYFVPTVSETNEIKKKLIDDYNDKCTINNDIRYNRKIPQSFDESKEQDNVNGDTVDNKASSYGVRHWEDLNQSRQNELLHKKIAEYSKTIYKKTKQSIIDKRTSIVCQREIPFYVDSVRKFRDQRYVYKTLLKKSTERYEKETNLETKKRLEKEMIVYSSLQVAHKCILNSFYGYVMRKGARWHSTEMAAIVCNIGSQIIKSCKQTIANISIPLELDTDGIWALFPSNFPILVKFKSGRKAEFMKSYINHKVCGLFKNEQYQEREGDGFVSKTYSSIEFEIDGSYKGMIIPAALEEGKQLKKRYIVLNWDNTIAELKGFELKRNGELEIVKRLQEDLFEQLQCGSNLQECYDALASSYSYWYKIIAKKGSTLDQDTILELFTECKSMSKNISKYESQASNTLLAAKKLAELLGNDILSEKLKVEYIILRFPENEAVSSRAIPTLIFRSTKKVHFIKKWCKINSVPGIKELIDWKYYKKRIEDIAIKLICLPALHQHCKNPLPDITVPQWSTQLTTAYDYLKFRKVDNKRVLEHKPTHIINSCDIDKYTKYYEKIKERHGVVYANLNGQKLTVQYYNKNQQYVVCKHKLYIKADTKYYIKRNIKRGEYILSNSSQPIILGCIEEDEQGMLENDPMILNKFTIPCDIHHIRQDYKIAKNLSFWIVTTFEFSRKLFYVLSKNDVFYFVSNFQHPKVMNVDISSFIKLLCKNIVVLNYNDKNLSRLQELCTDTILLYEHVQCKKVLGPLSTLLELQQSHHHKIRSDILVKVVLSEYANIPVGNIKTSSDVLKYLFYKELVKSNGIHVIDSEANTSQYHTEKLYPGYYGSYTIQFECPGFTVLSILEHKNILASSVAFPEIERLDFRIVYKVVSQLLSDHCKNVEAAKYLVNELETWLLSNDIFSSKLYDLIRLLRQRFIFNLISALEACNIKLVYVSGNIFCIDTEKYTQDGCDEISNYVRRKISECSGCRFLDLKALQSFDKTLFVNPNTYFYQKANKYGCVSDVGLPAEYIKKYFDDDLHDTSYIYMLITRVTTDTAKLILTTLGYLDGMCDVIHNCEKIKRIAVNNNHADLVQMLIVCQNCKTENVLRKRCVKCLHRYARDDVDHVVSLYFGIYLKLHLGNDTYCTKCKSINERRLVEYCKCGGLYKKGNYIKQLMYIVDKCKSTENLVAFKKKLSFYKINNL